MSFTSRWSDVYLIAGSRAVSVCGDFLAATALALVLQRSGHGGLAVSGLFVAAGLPVALLAPVAGRVADRVDSRTVLVIAGLVQALICLVLAFTTHPVAIIALVALLACGLAVTQPTLSALVPEMVRPADLARASGLSQTAGAIGMMVAPALAGVLLGRTGGARLPLLLDAASFLALVVAGFAVRTRRGKKAEKSIKMGAKYRFRDDRVLVVMTGALAAVVAGISAINVLDVFFVRDTLHGSTTMFGLIAASWTVGLLIGGVLLARVPARRITVRAVLLLAGATCVPVLAASAVTSAGWMIPLWIAGGVGNGGINIFIMVIVSGRTAAEVRGSAFAVVAGVVEAASLAGLLVAGPLVDAFDPRLLVAAAGAAGTLAALACLALVRRETPAAPAALDPLPARDSVEA